MLFSALQELAALQIRSASLAAMTLARGFGIDVLVTSKAAQLRSAHYTLRNKNVIIYKSLCSQSIIIIILLYSKLTKTMLACSFQC